MPHDALYFAHPINTYGTELETYLLNSLRGCGLAHTIVNPNTPKHHARVNQIMDDGHTIRPLRAADFEALYARRLSIEETRLRLYGEGAWPRTDDERRARVVVAAARALRETGNESMSEALAKHSALVGDCEPPSDWCK